MLKIACDNQVPDRFIPKLRRHGYDVVFLAEDQADEDWVNEALCLGAEIFVSPDLDIPNLLEKTDAVWIDYKSDKGNVLEHLLLQLWNAKEHIKARNRFRCVND